MFEHIPQQIDKALFYFHSAGTTSEEIHPFLPQLIAGLPNTYIWAGDGVISRSPLMRQGLFYGGNVKHYWFSFPMQDASSPQSFARHVEAMGAVLSCAGAYVNALVDQVMSRFCITAKQVILSGFQHGSCLALAASMIRLRDPFALTILFEPYLLESYYLKEELLLPRTTVVCIDNRHIRQRTHDWLQIDTDQQFRAYGMTARSITVDSGGDHLDAAMMDEAITLVRNLPPSVDT